MVRVLAVSDEIAPAMQDERMRSLRPDVLLAAGDLPWDYLESVAELFGVPAAFVPGNHEPAPDPDAAAPRGFVNVDLAVEVVGGLRVAGLGGCVRYNDGPYQYTQEEYHRRAARLAATAGGAGVDVLLTHAPPLGLGDGSDPAHVGIAALHDVLGDLEPAWHLHGHIHPHGFGKPDRTVGRTTVRNVIPWNLVEVEVGDAS